jgi:ribosomal protein L18E
MAKKTATESDETRLKKKVAAKLTDHKNPKEDEALRSLRKRLRRAQRKRRALALRKINSASKKTTAPASK